MRKMLILSVVLRKEPARYFVYPQGEISAWRNLVIMHNGSSTGAFSSMVVQMTAFWITTKGVCK